MPRAKAPTSKSAAQRAEPDPKVRILAAALDEFAARGYEAASTNAIAERAHVAKGLIFHYFGNKERLYVALVMDTQTRLLDEFWPLVEDAPSDLFARVLLWTQVRLRLISAKPAAYRLLAEMMTQVPLELRQEILTTLAPVQVDAWNRLQKGLDASLLRPDVTQEQAIRMLSIFQAGLERQVIPQIAQSSDFGLSQLEAITRETFFYLGLLRDSLYRPDAPHPPLDPTASPER
jgi:AcrR family transcriptional regulator